MNRWNDLKEYRVVRLNATLFPIREPEAELYQKYNITPQLVEANTPDEQIPQLADCDAILIVSAPLTTQVVKSLARCRIISRLGAGTDKIDVATATARGIVVSNVPDFCVEEQADHTMALLLALTRQLPQTGKDMRAGEWNRARQNPYLQRLAGHTLGLVGFGRSARAVAKRAQAFGMRVLATRRNKTAPRREIDELGVEMMELDELLAASDYVSLHLPLNADTYHLLDDAALRRMKPTAFLINTSRGAIVDEDALVAALREGRLAGAGLDTYEHINVFSETEFVPQHPLLELDNVVLTPHIAATSPDAMYAVSKGGVENTVAVLSGYLPPADHIVNPAVTPRFPLKEYDPRLFEDAAA
ncbi:MAG TPA: C-terminal binding protein [Anaerolineae bacterium]|nr:C-terminal binding protein [Anaerolineae bacterium]